MKQENKKVKTSDAISIIAVVATICVNMVLWSAILQDNSVEAVSYTNMQDAMLEQASVEQLDLTEIINENTKDIITEEITVIEEDLEYTSVYQNNDMLPRGTIQVVQEGRTGKQNIITKKTYKNGELLTEETDTKIITATVDRIIEIGTANYKSNYKVKAGDELYVTSTTLAVRTEPDRNAYKIVTLEKGTKVKLLEIQNGWYYITYDTYKGWAQADCLTYINPNANTYEEANGTYTKSQLLSRLSKNMSLNKASGLSLDQFKKVLSGNSSDKNSILANNAEYFYYAEKQYNVNGIFIAAVAIHESNWGTSKIARNKNNLFGYGASDGDPYNNAKTFSSYAEGIDLLARVFVKYYLNPAGTSIYGGEVANGKYYNGTTLSAVNKRYASDKNWANGVYKWMSYLYNRL